MAHAARLFGIHPRPWSVLSKPGIAAQQVMGVMLAVRRRITTPRLMAAAGEANERPDWRTDVGAATFSPDGLGRRSVTHHRRCIVRMIAALLPFCLGIWRSASGSAHNTRGADANPCVVGVAGENRPPRKQANWPGSAAFTYRRHRRLVPCRGSRPTVRLLICLRCGGAATGRVRI